MKGLLSSLLLLGLDALSPHSSPFVWAEPNADALAASKLLSAGFPDVFSFFRVRDVEVNGDEDIIYLEKRPANKPVFFPEIGDLEARDLEARADAEEAKEYCHSLKVESDFFQPFKKDGTLEERFRRLFSTKLIFPNVKNVYKEVLNDNPAELAQICKDGYIEMVNHPQYQGINQKRRPGAMTALAIDNEIYLSSSVKGGSLLYTIDREPSKIETRLNECLINCQKRFYEDLELKEGDPEFDSDIHKSGASCGECMVGIQYFEEHPTSNDFGGSPFVTVIEDAKAAGKTLEDRIKVIEPCFTDKLDPDGDEFAEGWGCGMLLREGNGVGVDQNKFEPYIIGRKQGWDDETYKKAKTYFEVKQVKIDVMKIKAEE